MKGKLVVGLDIGTTSAKAVVFDAKGKLYAEAEEMVTTHYPEYGYAEQDPKEVETAARKVMRDVLAAVDEEKYELVATGLCTAMHSLICVDEVGNPLSKMLIWSDGRAGEQAERLLDSGKGDEIYSRTGTPIHPMTPFTKLMWMKENEEPAYKQAKSFMTMKEYLVYHWFGERVIDYAMASSTGMFDVKNQVWDKEALELAGVEESQLAPVVEPTYELTGLIPEVKESLGVPANHRFIIGSADGQLANLGSGATSPGEVNISVGTSGAIRQFIDGAPINDKMETFTYAFSNDTSIIGGPTNNGGIVLQWFKDLIKFPGNFTAIIETAKDVEPGANGILFLPYVNGERAPLWVQKTAGNFYGLQVEHTQAEVTRAVLEGIAFNIYQISQSLEKLAGAPKKITVNGGLTRSEIWVQILADIFGEDLYFSETHHNAAWGAAWVALVAAGEAKAFQDIKENLPTEKKITANKENHEAYQKVYKKYEKLADAVTVLFDEI
ncbi:gluconokinase [Oceanobacillus alkalisoli]|uniref:gluconokinase n=1 Tax=Oceanobacillus alkalisoli TaxID=2925113 RepID=UPI001F119936|nr:gluconokinase [Oceanobacillus alkalisoli]MCF3943947.1 gluconokinase [Oceanobacillus alkalisoli]